MAVSGKLTDGKLELGVPGSDLSLYALSGKTSCSKISWNLEAARFGLNFSNRSEIWRAPPQQRC